MSSQAINKELQEKINRMLHIISTAYKIANSSELNVTSGIQTHTDLGLLKRMIENSGLTK